MTTPSYGVTAQGLAGFCTSTSLFITINSITLHSVKAFRIFFFQVGYKKNIRITILMLTIALLEAAGQKWGALGRIKT